MKIFPEGKLYPEHIAAAAGLTAMPLARIMNWTGGEVILFMAAFLAVAYAAWGAARLARDRRMSEDAYALEHEPFSPPREGEAPFRAGFAQPGPCAVCGGRGRRRRGLRRVQCRVCAGSGQVVHAVGPMLDAMAQGLSPVCGQTWTPSDRTYTCDRPPGHAGGHRSANARWPADWSDDPTQGETDGQEGDRWSYPALCYQRGTVTDAEIDRCIEAMKGTAQAAALAFFTGRPLGPVAPFAADLAPLCTEICRMSPPGSDIPVPVEMTVGLARGVVHQDMAVRALRRGPGGLRVPYGRAIPIAWDARSYVFERGGPAQLAGEHAASVVSPLTRVTLREAQDMMAAATAARQTSTTVRLLRRDPDGGEVAGEATIFETAEDATLPGRRPPRPAPTPIPGPGRRESR